ncbi:hypothetical protein EVAR_100911_1 [Eumeta japonica]|uniref:Uncharacterized protein n=1 Tax=Eumeta variegata TaxID=151549 RepID=A0A4C2A6Z2_EUMVA|nr:hypothetical protein EVAR_100911_1 [Eumeta japonica]
MTTESSLLSALQAAEDATKMDSSVKKGNEYGIYGFQVIVLGKRRMKERQYNGHALYQWRMSIVLLDLRS